MPARFLTGLTFLGVLAVGLPWGPHLLSGQAQSVQQGHRVSTTFTMPTEVMPRRNFFVGGQFVNAVIRRWNNGQHGFRPLELLAAQGMTVARGCMTTVSSPELESRAASDWQSLGWKDSYWSSLQMITQLFRDALAAGMKVNACFYLSDVAAHASVQNAPAAWRGRSVDETAALLEQYTFETTTYLQRNGIRVELYDIGNEILYGILNFTPGDRVPIGPGIDRTRDIAYLRSAIWPIEATLLKAAIRGVRRADPSARIVLHVETSVIDTMYAFFETMYQLGVPYDVAGLSLPYVEFTDLSRTSSAAYFAQWSYLVSRVANLGKPTYIAETSYPATTVAGTYPSMPEFPYTEAGQAGYVRSHLRWATNNPNVIGWTWFYPEWFPGINPPPAPALLEASGLLRDANTVRPAALEFQALARRPGSVSGAPANLRGTVSGHTVTLQWEAPSTGGVPAGYILEAGSGPGLANVGQFSVAAMPTELSIHNVPNGTYYVRIRGLNAAGMGEPSNEALLRVGGSACNAPPTAPSAFTASVTGSVVTLSWAASAGATSYEIEAGLSTGRQDAARIDTQNSSTSLTTSAPAGTYFVRVRARNSCGTSAATVERVVTVS